MAPHSTKAGNLRQSGLSRLDTSGIGHYKPPTFRQAVSFHRSIGAPRAAIHETQTLPLTAKCQNCGCMIAASLRRDPL